MSTPPSTSPPPEDRGRGDADNHVGVQASGSAFRSFVPWLTAACFAIAAARLGQLYISARTEAALLQQQRELSQLTLQAARNQLEAEGIITSRQIADLTQKVTDNARRIEVEKDRVASAAASAAGAGAVATTPSPPQIDFTDLKIATLTPPSQNASQGALAVVVWDAARQEGVLKIENLPALAADQDYQLWLVDPLQAAPVDAGVFAIDAPLAAAAGASRGIAFKAKQPVRTVEAFAISRGRKGGAARPEGDFILFGK